MVSSYQSTDVRLYTALYDREMQDEDEVKLREGDLVEVLERRSADWWYVKVRGELGLAQSNYLERIEVDAGKPPEQEKGASGARLTLYTAIYDSKKQADDEVELRKGDLVEVLERRSANWWYVKVNGELGLAPTSFLGKIAVDSVRTPVQDEGDNSGNAGYETLPDGSMVSRMVRASILSELRGYHHIGAVKHGLPEIVGEHLEEAKIDSFGQLPLNTRKTIFEEERKVMDRPSVVIREWYSRNDDSATLGVLIDALVQVDPVELTMMLEAMLDAVKVKMEEYDNFTPSAVAYDVNGY